MECRLCGKTLNEMTIACDSCGAHLEEIQVKVDLSTLEKQVIHESFDHKLPSDLVEELKQGYLLSKIRWEESKKNQKIIDVYLDYVFLRLLYEKDKYIMLTDNYNTDKALAILNSLVNMKFTKDIREFLQTEFKDDYVSHTIPEEYVWMIDKFYQTNYTITKYLPKRYHSGLLQEIIKGNKPLYRSIQNGLKKKLKTVKYRMKRRK